MPRTKHLVVFFILLAVLLLGIFVIVLFKQDKESGAAAISDALFVEAERVLDIEADVPKKDTSVRESLLRKLRGWTGTNDDPSNETSSKGVDETSTEPSQDENPSVGEDGVVLGDGMTAPSPQPERVFSCTQQFGDSQRVSPTWIEGDRWYPEAKPVVSGSVSWQNDTGTELADGRRIIVSNGLPPHTTGVYPVSTSYEMYADVNTGAIRSQNIMLELPRNPSLAPSPSCLPPGMVGIGLSGVAIYSGLTDTGHDAVAYEMLDACGGHPDTSGVYHYHNESKCLVDAFYEGAESTLIGYALDGFGIFSGTESGVVLTNDELDACHGHLHEIPWDGEIVSLYHYHMTDAYPYTLGCFMGTPINPSPEVTVSESEGATSVPEPPPAGDVPPPQLEF